VVSPAITEYGVVYRVSVVVSFLFQNNNVHL